VSGVATCKVVAIYFDLGGGDTPYSLFFYWQNFAKKKFSKFKIQILKIK
jgi:hypothetical protein